MDKDRERKDTVPSRGSANAKMSLEERIYRAPVINVIAICSAAALGLCLLVTVIFLICGGTFYTVSGEDGATYRYIGIMRGDVPTLGIFRGTDGSGGSINGDKIKFKDGSVYEGGIRFLDFEGEGVYTDENGNEFSGSFSGGKLEGGATVKYADGGSFAGNFARGLAEGYGERVYADGSSYKGYFSGGVKSGYGEFEYADGSSYKGYFANDMRHGEGEYRFAGGDTYTGEFENNVINGFGTYFFSSGRVFTGEFVAGVPRVG